MSKLNLNANAAVDVLNDLPMKPNFMINSWFAVGHFESCGHHLSYLVHVMTQMMPNMSAPMVTSCVSVTDHTTGRYYTDSKLDPLDNTTISSNDFHLVTSNAEMSGSMDQLHISAKMPHVEVHVNLVPEGYAIYNGGTGKFPLVGMNIYQYSIPTIATHGTISIDQTIFEVEGQSWFDRQWEVDLTQLPQIPSGSQQTFKLPKWGWMDLNLDNQVHMSLWFANEENREHAFATVLHPDGQQEVVAVSPVLTQASMPWTSPDSGYRYPTKWVVEMPSLATKLTITCDPKPQELLFNVKELSHYEAASEIEGTFRDKAVKGNCYVELIGEWQ